MKSVMCDTSHELIELEKEKAAHNYHPIPVVFSKAQGVHVWDPEGVVYYDFLSAYCTVNQGHCNPRIISALNEQVQKCTISSRAFYNDVFPKFADYITSVLDYEMVCPMNTGVEAVETALKLARKWAYTKKGIPQNEAITINCSGCFHGRTLAVVSMSDDPALYKDFGPYLPGFHTVPFGDYEALENYVEKNASKIAAFLVEPIQGEAGVVVPPDGYLKKCYDLCKKNQILFIADEVQTGLCRTGKLLACDHENFRPDVLILGKALSGGLMPISCVLSSKDILLTIKPGEHGSTFGGNPLSSAVAIASLKVLIEEKMDVKAQEMGLILRQALEEFQKNFSFIKTVRGRGLLYAIVVKHDRKNAWDLCTIFKNNGLLAKPTHDDIIRLSPPLVITREQMNDSIGIIKRSLDEFSKLL